MRLSNRCGYFNLSLGRPPSSLRRYPGIGLKGCHSNNRAGKALLPLGLDGLASRHTLSRMCKDVHSKFAGRGTERLNARGPLGSIPSDAPCRPKPGSVWQRSVGPIGRSAGHQACQAQKREKRKGLRRPGPRPWPSPGPWARPPLSPVRASPPCPPLSRPRPSPGQRQGRWPRAEAQRRPEP